MTPKNKMASFIALAAMATMADTVGAEYRPSSGGYWRKSNMTKAQKHRRTKAKASKKARKKNRK